MRNAEDGSCSEWGVFNEMFTRMTQFLMTTEHVSIDC